MPAADGAGARIVARSGMVLSCVKPGSAEPSNKGMKQTKLVAAPVKRTAVPPRAFRRFAAVRTASQLIPGVRRTNGGRTGFLRPWGEQLSPEAACHVACKVRKGCAAKVK